MLPCNAQIQNPNWVLFTSQGQNSNTCNIRFGTGPAVISNPESYLKTPQFFTDENNQPITSYRGFNSYFDNDGFPILYVINANEKTYLYDKHGKRLKKKHANPSGLYGYIKETQSSGFITYFEDKDYIEKFSRNLIEGIGDGIFLNNTSREISILKVGCNLLHVIVGEMILEVDLTKKSWDFFIPHQSSGEIITSNFLNSHGVTSLEMGSGSIVSKESFHAIRRDPTSENKYQIYFLYSTLPSGGDSRPIYLTKLNVDAEAYTVEYGSPYYLRNASLPQQFQNDLQFVSELEVSPDGSKLAIHDPSRIFVYGINGSTKNIDTYIGHYNYTSSVGTEDNIISGLEFTANSSKLVFNRYDANAVISSTKADRVGVLDISNPSSFINYAIPVNYLSENIGSKSFSVLARGGLELGRDGEIYCPGLNGIHKIDLTTMAILDVPDISVAGVGTINLLNDAYKGTNYSIRPLPEQIDGQPFISTGYQLDDDILSPTTSGDLNFTETCTTNGILKIRGEIEVFRIYKHQTP